VSGATYWEERLVGRDWDYTLFNTQALVRNSGEMIEMVPDRIRRKGESTWRINGESFAHRIHTSFAEVAVVAGLSQSQRSGSCITPALAKLRADQHGGQLYLRDHEGHGDDQTGRHVTVNYTVKQPRFILFHCHMQNHMDGAFMGFFVTTWHVWQATGTRGPIDAELLTNA
jgi:hypothetical protein